jgi:hypothetical protein
MGLGGGAYGYAIVVVCLDAHIVWVILRICIGMHIANQALFIDVASLLWAVKAVGQVQNFPHSGWKCIWFAAGGGLSDLDDAVQRKPMHAIPGKQRNISDSDFISQPLSSFGISVMRVGVASDRTP